MLVHVDIAKPQGKVAPGIFGKGFLEIVFHNYKGEITRYAEVCFQTVFTYRINMLKLVMFILS